MVDLRASRERFLDPASHLQKHAWIISGCRTYFLRIRATRGRSSRPNPLKDQGDSRKAPSPANFARFLGEFHSVAKQASFCNAFGRDFGGLWKPKWMQKLMLGLVFFDVVLECAFALILVRIFEAPNLKNQALASTGARFLQNRRFRKMFEKSLILESFSEAKTTKFR